VVPRDEAPSDGHVLTERNPYTPPAAPVTSNEPPRRPRSVGIAFVLLWGSLAIGLLLGIWRLAAISDQGIAFVAGSVSFVMMNVLVIGLFFWIFRAVAKGRHWGRITVLVMAVVGSFAIAWTLQSLGEISAIDVVVRYGMWIAATVLLFVPASSAWYREMKDWRRSN
jgi:hypothetical protein